MEAERLYTKQPSRTIQQKRGGEGASEMVDNRIRNDMLQLTRSARRLEAYKRARKKVASRLEHGVDAGTRRVASGGNLIAISGATNDPTVSAATNRMWLNMINKHNVQQKEAWDIRNCAESHLWLKLVDKNIRPKNITMVVGQYSENMKVRGDRPCKNCAQWVHKEFNKVVGHI